MDSGPVGRPVVYLETTVVSYLTAKPSRDVVMAGHQQSTREWWAYRNRTLESLPRNWCSRKQAKAIRRQLSKGWTS